MSDAGRQFTYGVRNLVRDIAGASRAGMSEQGGHRSSGGSGGGSRAGSGGLDPHSFKFWWWYGGGKPQVHRRRHKAALIASGVSLLIFAGVYFGIFGLAAGALGALVLALVIAWAAYSGRMYEHPRKIVRKLSLEADYDYDDDIEHKTIFVDGLISGGFIKDNVTVKQFWCHAEELDQANPWKFKVRILFSTFTPSTLQSQLENIKFEFFNPDMGDSGAYCQRVIVEPDDRGRCEWFYVFLYFDMETASYADIGTPQELRRFNRPGGASDNERKNPPMTPGEDAPAAVDGGDFSAYTNITSHKYGDTRTRAERAMTGGDDG